MDFMFILILSARDILLHLLVFLYFTRLNILRYKNLIDEYFENINTLLKNNYAIYSSHQ